jgi:hypothetical protein
MLNTFVYLVLMVHELNLVPFRKENEGFWKRNKFPEFHS